MHIKFVEFYYSCVTYYIYKMSHASTYFQGLHTLKDFLKISLVISAIACKNYILHYFKIKIISIF